MYSIKYSRWRVKASIRKMAKKLRRENRIHEDTVFLVMLSGGVWFAHHLFDQLGNLTNEVYYIKGHSYEQNCRGQFVWDLLPQIDLQERDVIIIDDICDSGETLKAICAHFTGKVKSMIGITLLKRLPCTIQIGMPLYSCIEDDTTSYFVGCGLDDNRHGRLLSYIGITN